MLHETSGWYFLSLFYRLMHHVLQLIFTVCFHFSSNTKKKTQTSSKACQAVQYSTVFMLRFFCDFPPLMLEAWVSSQLVWLAWQNLSVATQAYCFWMQLCGLWEWGCKEALNDRSVHSGQSAHCCLLFTCLWPSHCCHCPGAVKLQANELLLFVEKVLCLRILPWWRSAESMRFSRTGTQLTFPPPVCTCLCGSVCVLTHEWGGCALQQHFNHISGERQTQL